MSNSLVTYVSSENNREKRSQINNVIQSLHCYINNSTPDKTEQEYGILSYTGKIKKGQVIQGNKRSSKKSGTPVIANGAYLGDIDQNGRLVIDNIVGGTSSITTRESYIDIQYCLVQDNTIASCTSCYWKDAMYLDGVTVTCCECEDQDGTYMEITTCCTWKQPIHERCVFSNAYRGSTALESADSHYMETNSTTIQSWKNLCAVWCSDNYFCCNYVGWRAGDPYDSYYGTGYYNLCSVANAYKICQSSPDGPVCIYYCSDYKFKENMEIYWSDEYGPHTEFPMPLCNPVTYCSCAEIGPFLCGYCDGKMVFDKLPGSDTSSVTYTDSVSRFFRNHDYGSGCSPAYFYDCWGNCCYQICGCKRTKRSTCGCMDKVSSYCPNNNGKVMICQNSVWCCTLCVVTKQRPLECVSINERYI